MNRTDYLKLLTIAAESEYGLKLSIVDYEHGRQFRRRLYSARDYARLKLRDRSFDTLSVVIGKEELLIIKRERLVGFDDKTVWQEPTPLDDFDAAFEYTVDTQNRCESCLPIKRSVQVLAGPPNSPVVRRGLGLRRIGPN